MDLVVDSSGHRPEAVAALLLGHVEGQLRTDGVRLLQVKTFGPSGTSREYERTRAFYESVGFLALEERTDIWGPENPCLLSVKPLDRLGVIVA